MLRDRGFHHARKATAGGRSRHLDVVAPRDETLFPDNVKPRRARSGGAAVKLPPSRPKRDFIALLVGKRPDDDHDEIDQRPDDEAPAVNSRKIPVPT